MCINIHSENLNFGPYFPHPTSIYICRVTIMLMVHRGTIQIFFFAQRNNNNNNEKKYNPSNWRMRDYLRSF